MSQQEQRSTLTPCYLLLSSFFITTLLLSNIVAGKMATFFGVTLPAAVFLFPLTYVTGDILTEVYGFKQARFTIWLGLFANLLMALVFALTLALPYPEFWPGQPAYRTVLGMTPRLVAASTAAYFVGELLNAALLSKLKVKTKGRWLWLRTIASTIVGEGIDTFLFITVAFTGTMPQAALWAMMFAQYLWKVTYEIATTPLTYLLVRWIKRREQLDVFDYDVKYNPFRLDWRREK
jgi:uncharacterized integral membrane protein (TIGR00697 family)